MAYPIYQTPSSMPPGLLAPEQGGFEGLLSNPLFNIGMGILASNRGNYGNAGAALSQGALLGLQQTQQQKQATQINKLRDIQLKNQTTEADTLKRQQDAITKFKQNFPELASAVDIDPKSAIKAAYPQISNNSADPYFTVVATDKGLGAFNNRTGEFSLLPSAEGGALVKSTDSPLVRGAVKGAEAQAGAAWKPNTDIDGVVLTDEQVSRMAHGNNPIPFSPQPITGLPTNNFNTPYPVTFGAPGTTATDLAEGVTGEQSISVGNPARPNVDGGIRVPTAAELAGKKKAAEVTAEDTAKARADVNKAIAQGEETLKLIDELVGSKDGSIKPHPGFEAAVGTSSKFDPRNYLPGTDATGFNVRLDQLKGKQFLQAFESLKGGGQITEVEGKKATDAIARMNTAVSETEFIQAARDFQNTIRGALDRAKAKAGNSGNGSPPLSAQPIKIKGNADYDALPSGAEFIDPFGKRRRKP